MIWSGPEIRCELPKSDQNILKFDGVESMIGKGRILFPQHFHREAESGGEYPNFIVAIAIIIGITTIIIINIMINNIVIVNNFIIYFTFK